MLHNAKVPLSLSWLQTPGCNPRDLRETWNLWPPNKYVQGLIQTSMPMHWSLSTKIQTHPRCCHHRRCWCGKSASSYRLSTWRISTSGDHLKWHGPLQQTCGGKREKCWNEQWKKSTPATGADCEPHHCSGDEGFCCLEHHEIHHETSKVSQDSCNLIHMCPIHKTLSHLDTNLLNVRHVPSWRLPSHAIHSAKGVEGEGSAMFHISHSHGKRLNDLAAWVAIPLHIPHIFTLHNTIYKTRNSPKYYILLLIRSFLGHHHQS